MHAVSMGAGEPRATLLWQGPEAGGPALERQEDSQIRHKSTRTTEKSGTGMGRQMHGRKEAAGRSGRDRAKWTDGDGGGNLQGGGGMEAEGWKEKGWGGSSRSQHCREEGPHPAGAHRCPAWGKGNALVKAGAAHRRLCPPPPETHNLVS